MECRSIPSSTLEPVAGWRSWSWVLRLFKMTFQSGLRDSGQVCHSFYVSCSLWASAQLWWCRFNPGQFFCQLLSLSQAPTFHRHLHSRYALTGIKCIHLSVRSSVASTVAWLIKKLIDTNCCQLCQTTLTNLVSFLTFCSSWSLQCISAGTAWKHQGPLGRKYSWQLSGQTIATSLKTDSGGSVGKRCIFAMLIFLQLCDSIALDIFSIQLWPFSECNGSFSFKC